VSKADGAPTSTTALKNQRLASIKALALARWRELYREPGTLFWMFGFPLVLSIALGMAFRNQEPEPTYVGVIAGPEAEHVRALLAKSPDVSPAVMDDAAAHTQLKSGKIALVVIPGAPITYRFDPTRPESRLSRALVDDAVQRGAGRADPVVTANQNVIEPGSRYIDFLIPGLLGMGIMSSGLWGFGFALAEMRARKLLKRLIATPMQRSDFLLSFLLVRALLLGAELPPLLIFSYFAFHVGVAGSIVLLILVALLGAMVFTMMGLLLASRSQSPQIVTGLINIVTLPMYMCSGVFFSAARFPDWLQPFIRALPLTALIDSMRGVMIDGAGLRQIALPVLILVAWGTGSFALAIRLFKWR
jgi:ABC-2 type transport system permease protein